MLFQLLLFDRVRLLNDFEEPADWFVGLLEQLLEFNRPMTGALDWPISIPSKAVRNTHPGVFVIASAM